MFKTINNETDYDETEEYRFVMLLTAPAWCRPCVALAPHYMEAAEQSDIPFLYIDIDKNPWAVERFGIQGVPTMYLHERGNMWELYGRTTKDIIEEINHE